MARSSVLFGPGQRSVTFSNGTVLKAPGIRATQFTNDGNRLRAAILPSEIDTSPAFEAAMRNLGIVEAESIHLDVDVITPDDQIELQPEASAGPAPTAVLYQDESGGQSWHFPEGVAEPAVSLRPGLRSADERSQRKFVIPLRTAAARQAASSGKTSTRLRGPITKWGRKIFKVLVMPVLSDLGGHAMQAVVGAVESRNRFDRIWRITANAYTRSPRKDEAFQDWASLVGKRSLLVIHGIFSSVEGMLSQMPQKAVEELVAKYEGRVIAFNHLSVTKGPEENARFFLEVARQGTGGGEIPFDILCHSRGGIVARTLTECAHPTELASACEFRKVFFVATPNNGSALGDPRHIVDMIDVFTNVLTVFPDGPAMYSLETLLAIVKLLAYTFETNLPGLEAMGTQTYITKLNKRPPATRRDRELYGAAASDYEPDPESKNGFLTGPFANAIIDRVFRAKDGACGNDLVVPQQGVFGENGSPLFPIQNALVFGKQDHVWHGGFFSRGDVLTRIADHFEIGRQRIVTRGSTFGTRRSKLRSVSPTESIDSSEPQALRRWPEICFPGVVRENESNKLVVSLNELRTSNVGEGLEMGLPPGQTSIQISACISAPGFVILGPREKKIFVQLRKITGSESISFDLEAGSPGSEPGMREIRVDFWLDNSCIGSVAHAVTVLPKKYVGAVSTVKSPAADPVRLPRVIREFCDLIIGVTADSAGGRDRYSMTLRSAVPGRSYDFKDVGTLTLNGQSIASYLSELLDPEFESYPNDEMTEEQWNIAIGKWNQKFGQRLKEVGRQLWDQLPEEFRDEYFQLLEMSHPPRSIAIYADDMVFPWEIVVPWSDRAELASLGITHVLGRWKPGLSLRPDPQKFPLRKFVVMSPQYHSNNLPWSEEELAELQRIIPSLTRIKPCDMGAAQRLLGESDVQFLHFSGHGSRTEGENADLMALELEDGSFLRAISFVGRPIGRGNPILYLNACTVGRAGMVLGRSGGFTANCLKSGWTGIIAPYWPINDASAKDFAIAFYERLKLGRSVGEALQELRCEHPEDPTYQAYTYIGDPMTRLLFA